jgi:hypothetical protein
MLFGEQQDMKQSQLSDLDENGIGVCHYIVAGEGYKICGTRLVPHYLHGEIDYYFCPKCDVESKNK